MEEKPKTGLNTGLAITSLVIGIIALLFSFIPCIGALSIYVAPFAVALAAYAYNISKKTNQPTGLASGGLIVSLLALAIALYQAYQIRSANRSLDRMNNDLLNGRDPFANHNSSSLSTSQYILIAIVILVISCLIYYYRTGLKNMTSGTNNVINEEGTQTPQANFDFTNWISKNFKFIIALIVIIVSSWFVYINYLVNDPIRDGMKAAKMNCELAKNNTDRLIELRKEYLSNFNTYFFKSRKEATDKFDEMCKGQLAEYNSSFEKARDFYTKKRTSYLGDDIKLAKFDASYSQQTCIGDNSYELEKLVTEQWDRINKSFPEQNNSNNQSILPIDSSNAVQNNVFSQTTTPNDVSNHVSSIQGRFPLASERLLTPSDLSGLTKQDLKVIRNEIFARHGYIFKTEEMKSYFATQPWYKGQYEDITSMLSTIEKQNIEFIKKHE